MNDQSHRFRCSIFFVSPDYRPLGLRRWMGQSDQTHFSCAAFAQYKHKNNKHKMSTFLFTLMPRVDSVRQISVSHSLHGNDHACANNISSMKTSLLSGFTTNKKVKPLGFISFCNMFSWLIYWPTRLYIPFSAEEGEFTGIIKTESEIKPAAFM